jgi:hypothetical protein
VSTPELKLLWDGVHTRPVARTFPVHLSTVRFGSTLPSILGAK